MTASRNPTNIPKQHLEHAAVLQRPFVAPPPLGIYDGEIGTINRFIADGTVTLNATQTCGGMLYHPNTGLVTSLVAVTSSTAITPTLATSIVFTPGYGTLSTICQKRRSLASGIRFSIPSLSLTTVVGEFCMGVVSYDTAIGFTSIDNIFTLSQGRANVTRDLHEARWYPGSFDSKYSTFSGTIAGTGADTNDTNVVFVAFRGVPVNTVCSIQIVDVVEWTPKANTGLSVSGSTTSGISHQDTVALLHKHSPGWHHTAKQTAERLLEDTVHQVGDLAGKGLKKAATKIFEGGLAAFGL